MSVDGATITLVVGLVAACYGCRIAFGPKHRSRYSVEGESERQGRITWSQKRALRRAEGELDHRLRQTLELLRDPRQEGVRLHARALLLAFYGDPVTMDDLQDFTNYLQDIVGPTFDVFWRTASEYAPGGFVIRRLPACKEPIIGIPTDDDGGLIIDPVDEPGWIRIARCNGWEIIYGDRMDAEGRITVHFRRKPPEKRRGWLPRLFGT